ncbi:hypothetical protein PInf_006656 [Phytophthora infestans]|nr:hypothetical protein PInf_006656 [Phytophthora infestans]
MADLIEKIGRFFAEQEAQIQDTLTQVVHASTRSSLPHFYPPPPEEERPDLKATALANAEKVAAALTLAQERAKRIQQEKLQLERERELERQEAACRLQEQMVKIEAMSLEMHVKQRYIEKYKKRERARLKLEKVAQHNAVHRSKVARLAATKASLEMELAAVLEETAQTRQKRRELELADEKERLKRQREAERALQIRLREEEWKT